MGFISKFFEMFKSKEEINEETVTEKVINDRAAQVPFIVDGEGNNPVMVRADEFANSSTVPEEYNVVEDDKTDEVIEENKDHGIEVVEGDNMSPIIMNVDETDNLVQIDEEVSELIQENVASDEEEIIETIEIEEIEEDIEIL